MSNEVRDWRGRIIGYRCWECGNVELSMWGDTCNACREKERRHQELIAAIKFDVSNGTREVTP